MLEQLLPTNGRDLAQVCRWRRWACGVCALTCLGMVLATGYGIWLSTDRLPWIGPADCVVTLRGQEQNQHALLWLSQGRVREVWVVRAQDNILVQYAVQEHFADTSLRQLRQSGLHDSQIRVLPVDASEQDLPRLLQEIGQTSERLGVQQVVVQCDALESRYLRQIADAVLPTPLSDHLRFVSLPCDEFTASRWWLCRRGWKDAYDSSLEIMANLCCGPTSGFEPASWDPNAWELQTFQHRSPQSR